MNVPNPSKTGLGPSFAGARQPNQTAGGNSAPVSSPVFGPGALDESVRNYSAPASGPTNPGNVLPKNVPMKDCRIC